MYPFDHQFSQQEEQSQRQVVDEQYFPADIAGVDQSCAVICHTPVDHNGVEEGQNRRRRRGLVF